MDIVKLTTTIAIFLLTVIIYGYFVNISSTKGYFLRQELKSLEDAKFASSVTKLAIMKQEKQLWDTIKLSQNYNQKKVVISPKVVYIPVQKPQLAKR